MATLKNEISDTFDLVILGGGPAGYTAAVKASEKGLKTAVIEEDELGGICLNWGCIPVKALLRSAEVMETVSKAGDFGVIITGKSFDWGEVIKRSREAVDNLSKGLFLKVRNSGAVIIKGRGKLLGKGKVEIRGEKKTIITGDRIIIATGSKFANLPDIKIDGNHIITAKEALSLEKFPKSIGIIGSGAMGIEFASIFCSFGADVVLFEKFNKIFPTADIDISERLKALLKKRGIKIVNSAMISKVKDEGSQCVVEYNNGQTSHFDKVLVATGVTGNIDHIGLENAGISGTWGFIKVDGNFITASEKIYAIGDCIGPPLLAHSAFIQAELVIDHITGNVINPPELSRYPLCLHSLPNVAIAGLTEKGAREAGYDVCSGKSLFNTNGMAQAYGEKDGFAKIVFDRTDGSILGAHIIGHGAEDIIQELVFAMEANLTIYQVYNTIHPHPTLSEIIREAAFDALRKIT